MNCIIKIVLGCLIFSSFIPVSLARNTQEAVDYILANDITSLDYWHQAGGNANAIYEGAPLIYYALKDNTCHFMTLQSLIRNGAEINKPMCNNGLLPIYLAAQDRKGSLCFSYLVEHGADFNGEVVAIDQATAPYDGYTVYNFAAEANNKSVIFWLYENGLSPFEQNRYGMDAIHTGVMRGHYKAFEPLLKHIYKSNNPKLK